MTQRISSAAVRVAAFALLCPACLLANVVSDWNVVAHQAMATAKMRFPLQTRTLAIMHTAIFDAVNSTDRRYQPYVFDYSAPSADPSAAALAAGHDVLVALVPAQLATIHTAYTISLASVPDGPAKDQGVLLGQMAAAAVLFQRATDGWDVTALYTPGTVAGAWVPTAPTFGPAVFVAWGDVTPFAVNSSLQFIPEGPPALTSEQYTHDFMQVKYLGRIDSISRTADQTHAALFWFENSNLTWNAITRLAVSARNPNLLETARVFALLNIATADAIISGFKAKYLFGFWRPLTAIQRADIDGNDATEADVNWQPLAVLPLHPDYPSNHAAFSGAAAAVLSAVFGDDFAFTVSSSSAPGARSFASFAAAAEECALSRIWLGYHFGTAVRDGLRMGGQIGHFTLTHRLKREERP